MIKDLRIIKDNRNPGTFFKTSNSADVNSEKVSFSFENFNAGSVCNKKVQYNSYYQNIESSRNAVGDFFRTIKELSRFKIGELMSDRHVKENFHLTKIDRDEHINRIESVLKECYNYPLKKIEQFDREYYEFQISDGKRVIWHRLDNMICPLFIDCNHMICIESCREPKMKMEYSIESSFSHLGERELNKNDIEIIDYLKMIIQEYEEKSMSVDEIIDVLKDVCLHR